MRMFKHCLPMVTLSVPLRYLLRITERIGVKLAADVRAQGFEGKEQIGFVITSLVS